VAPGVHGDTTTGTQGAGAPMAAETAGLLGVPHIPNVGMFAIGTKSWIVPAGVSAVTGVPFGIVVSGTGTGGTAIEHVTMAPVLTSGGTASDCTPPQAQLQMSQSADDRAGNF